MKKTFYISTPIYYPSGKPHVGHAMTTILADVISKYKNLIGYDVFFVTGTDEHGKKIEESAKKANLSTIDFVDQNVKVFIELWKILGINYSRFIRTTNIQHIRTVQRIFSQYNQEGYIYLSDWKGHYCVSCEENILAKDIVVKDNKKYCSVGHELIDISESSYFFRMSKFKDWIQNQFIENSNWISPESRMKELSNNFLENNLEDLSISRTTFSWGIPILENQKHVMYVWMDALFNYLTALDFMQPNDSLYQKFWNHKDAEIVHLLSKEITRFHCVYWPIFLHALNVKLPTKIISHGWIVTKSGKMSKSLGNVIDPFEIVDIYGRDCLRYYLIKDMSLSNDNIFYEGSMVATFNGDLANNLGNLISRTIGMLSKYNHSKVPCVAKRLTKKHLEVSKLIKNINLKIPELINSLNPSSILNAVQDMVNIANKYIEETKPWELFKNNKTSDLNNLLNILSNVVRSSFFWLQPVLVDGVILAQEQFNLDFSKIEYRQLNNFSDLDNHIVNQSVPIYQRKEYKEE